ncbi:LysR family transcriptional regulator, partial [Mycobacterium tuberculosis]|nr:LysR family transcriptional regulator [Mycobacterium tuberculosis]
CQTVRLGSVSRAAEALFVSQPAISQQLQALEREVGVGLFERSGRRLVPSREGQLLFEMAHPLVESLDGLEASFRDKVKGLDAG